MPSLVPTVHLNLDYRQIRLRWCRASLTNFLRRWGIYIGAGMFVLGASGGYGTVTNMSSLLLLPLLPLLWALERSPAVIALAGAGYCAVGFIVCWSMRPLLWPPSWRDVERTLPISRRVQYISDLTVVLVGLTPLFALYAAGVFVWLVRTPHWKVPVLCAALALLLVSTAVSVLSGMVLLQVIRRHGRASRGPLATVPRNNERDAQGGATSVVAALLFLPLLRGPAHRAGRLLLFAPLLAAGHVLVILWPALTSWWLSALALLILLLTTRLNGVLESDLAPLHAACVNLPINPRHLLSVRRTVAMLPVVLSMAMLVLVLLWIGPSLRPLAVAGYLLTALAGNAWLVFSTHVASDTYKKDKPSTRASGWLVILAVQIALALEITV